MSKGGEHRRGNVRILPGMVEGRRRGAAVTADLNIDDGQVMQVSSRSLWSQTVSRVSINY